MGSFWICHKKFSKKFNNQLVKEKFKTHSQGISEILKDGSLLVEEQNKGRLIFFDKNGDKEWEAEIDNCLWKQKSFPYQAKCLKWIKMEFDKLSANDKKSTLDLISGSGCESILE